MKKCRKERYVSRLGNCGMADGLEDEIKILQAGEERGGSCASQSNGCCFDPAMVDQIFACGAVHAEHYIQAMQEEFIRRFKAPAALEQVAGGEERREWKEWEEDAKERRVGVTKALRWVLLWILLGTRMQMVKTTEEEISTRQETDCVLEKVPVPRAGDEIRWKRMRTCDGEKGRRRILAKRKNKNSQGKDPKIFEENSQGGTLKPQIRTATVRTQTFQENSLGGTLKNPKQKQPGEDPSTFEGGSHRVKKMVNSRKEKGR